MTWGEFKKEAEAKGVTDDTQLTIDMSQGEVIEISVTEEGPKSTVRFTAKFIWEVTH